MYFTSKEKVAIANLALKLELADEKLDDKEKSLTFLVFSKIGLNSSELKQSFEIKSTEAMLIIANMTEAEKMFVCAFYGTLIAIDGDISPAETKLWQLISAFCEFPEMSIAEAISKFADYV